MKIRMEIVVLADKKDDETIHDAIQKTIELVNETGLIMESCRHVMWWSEEE